jgi:hypothetical protein
VSSRYRSRVPKLSSSNRSHGVKHEPNSHTRLFASLIASTGFNPVEDPVEASASAKEPWPEMASDQDFSSGGGGI